MQDLFCIVVPISLAPLFLITMGLVSIFKKDWAWGIAEWMLRTVRPQRTPEWERSSTINGVIMLVYGLVFLLFILVKIL